MDYGRCHIYKEEKPKKLFESLKNSQVESHVTGVKHSRFNMNMVSSSKDKRVGGLLYYCLLLENGSDAALTFQLRGF